MLPYEDTTSLSLLFHLNSEPWGNLDAYSNTNYEIEYKQVQSCDAPVPLPAPAASPLSELFARRASCRAYAQVELPLQKAGDLLSGAYGVTRQDREILDGGLALLRAVPSAGGLFPLELFVVTQRVQAVPDGLHHYDVRNHKLEPIRTGNVFPELRSCLLMYDQIENANLILFLAAVFERTQVKYGPRGYRYILLEAGHVAQNVCLKATELGLGSLCMGGYLDAKLNRALNLDKRDEGVVYSIAVGVPA